MVRNAFLKICQIGVDKKLENLSLDINFYFFTKIVPGGVALSLSSSALCILLRFALQCSEVLKMILISSVAVQLRLWQSLETVGYEFVTSILYTLSETTN